MMVGYVERGVKMETIKLTTRIDDSGKLRLDLPTQLANRQVEVLVVLQPVKEAQTDELGWPIGYFEGIDAIEADDVMERGDQGT
jgi:hypothetical protein